ncbi:peptide deformylase [Leptolyngbya sp. CCY15150]|uniref:peptide deformylase n=1 Tax=Leptolyngbya sp. CCY15150 TaxID=2767772 RepID=UPI00194F5E6F|nr:peptide deformylase [Leptolyngbya sp. CCY15150]
MTAQILVEKTKLETPPLTLHYLGDRVLRQPAKRIAKVDDSVRQLIKEMLQTMYSEDGIGLAAPQVGVHKQLIVVDCDPENAASPPLVLINPVIKSSSPETCAYEEGCLSIPGVYLGVTRPEVIEVAYKDENGRPQRLKAKGLLSRAIQHEIDHLNGVMFVDRVDNGIALTQALDKQGFSIQAVQAISA